MSYIALEEGSEPILAFLERGGEQFGIRFGDASKALFGGPQGMGKSTFSGTRSLQHMAAHKGPYVLCWMADVKVPAGHQIPGEALSCDYLENHFPSLTALPPTIAIDGMATPKWAHSPLPTPCMTCGGRLHGLGHRDGRCSLSTCHLRRWGFAAAIGGCFLLKWGRDSTQSEFHVFYRKCRVVFRRKTKYVADVGQDCIQKATMWGLRNRIEPCAFSAFHGRRRRRASMRPLWQFDEWPLPIQEALTGRGGDVSQLSIDKEWLCLKSKRMRPIAASAICESIQASA